MMTRFPSVMLLVGLVLASGCGSTSTDTRNSYHPSAESAVSNFYANARTKSDAQPVIDAPPAAYDRPAVTVSSSDRRPPPSKPSKNSAEYALPGGEVAIGPAVTTKDGTKLVPLKSKGWHCDKCGRTYNGEGWCCGQELRRTE